MPINHCLVRLTYVWKNVQFTIPTNIHLSSNWTTLQFSFLNMSIISNNNSKINSSSQWSYFLRSIFSSSHHLTYRGQFNLFTLIQKYLRYFPFGKVSLKKCWLKCWRDFLGPITFSREFTKCCIQFSHTHTKKKSSHKG